MKEGVNEVKAGRRQEKQDRRQITGRIEQEGERRRKEERRPKVGE